MKVFKIIAVLTPLFGLFSLVFGINWLLHPCNYNTVAQVDFCYPSEKLGDAYYGITYNDYNNNTYNSLLLLDIPCYESDFISYQTIDICYLKNNPSDVRLDEAFIQEPTLGFTFLVMGVLMWLMTIMKLMLAEWLLVETVQSSSPCSNEKGHSTPLLS